MWCWGERGISQKIDSRIQERCIPRWVYCGGPACMMRTRINLLNAEWPVRSLKSSRPRSPQHHEACLCGVLDWYIYSHSPVFETPWSMRQTWFLSSKVVQFSSLLFHYLHEPCKYMILNFLSYILSRSSVLCDLSKLWGKSEYDFETLWTQTTEKSVSFWIIL